MEQRGDGISRNWIALRKAGARIWDQKGRESHDLSKE